MFNFFPFKGGGVFTFGSFSKIDDITDLYKGVFSSCFGNEDEEDDEEKSDFIKFQSYEDMYLLTIELRGIDLRELSIQYNPGIIDINLMRLEIDTNQFGIKRQVKKCYNKKFDNIEEIETDQVLKSIDNEILSIRMPKKFSIDGLAEIVDIDYTEVTEDEVILLEGENNPH